MIKKIEPKQFVRKNIITGEFENLGSVEPSVWEIIDKIDEIVEHINLIEQKMEFVLSRGMSE